MVYHNYTVDDTSSCLHICIEKPFAVNPSVFWQYWFCGRNGIWLTKTCSANPEGHIWETQYCSNVFWHKFSERPFF